MLVKLIEIDTWDQEAEVFVSDEQIVSFTPAYGADGWLLWLVNRENPIRVREDLSEVFAAYVYDPTVVPANAGEAFLGQDL